MYFNANVGACIDLKLGWEQRDDGLQKTTDLHKQTDTDVDRLKKKISESLQNNFYFMKIIQLQYVNVLSFIYQTA